MAVVSYMAIPVHGAGSNPSETHLKAGHGIQASQIKVSSCNAGYGSTRSDFAAIVNNNNDLQFAFFLVEFEQNGFEVHKDDIVVVAEAVHEFNRYL
ncbi:12200_t:CDS:2 [Gigaspora margarita]|uniref:12200_t:CDS:1 n=1 Tax=Gigaspora margarita TaxID=4874 RepID=A0ABN7V4R4_GIGMA|nr:12200_t:CDS:2 [Gigaspora margarita]